MIRCTESMKYVSLFSYTRLCAFVKLMSQHLRYVRGTMVPLCCGVKNVLADTRLLTKKKKGGCEGSRHHKWQRRTERQQLQFKTGSRETSIKIFMWPWIANAYLDNERQKTQMNRFWLTDHPVQTTVQQMSKSTYLLYKFIYLYCRASQYCAILKNQHARVSENPLTLGKVECCSEKQRNVGWAAQYICK